MISHLPLLTCRPPSYPTRCSSDLVVLAVRRGYDVDQVVEEADLLLRFPHGAGDFVGVVVVDPPAGESDLARMLAQSGRTLGQDQAGFGAVGDRDQHGGGKQHDVAVDAGIAGVGGQDADLPRLYRTRTRLKLQSLLRTADAVFGSKKK